MCSSDLDFTFETISSSTVAISDPNGQPVVVRVGGEYKWNSSLDGVTLWSVSGSESEGDWYALTAKFSGGKLIYGFEFADDVSDTGVNSVTYEIDANGYIKSLEGDGDYQYYNVVSVENGVIGTIQNDQGVESVADNGINQVDQWFFTTRAAAEEFYNSKLHYAPSSLVGKTIYIPEEGFVANYSFTEDEAYYVIPLSLDQVEGIPYSYVASTSTTATLTLARKEGDVIHQISFSSPTTADSNWTDLESNETGSATLQILTEDYWPSTLAGWS